jgi:hypothetical protein
MFVLIINISLIGNIYSATGKFSSNIFCQIITKQVTIVKYKLFLKIIY